MTRISTLKIETDEDQGQITFYNSTGTRVGSVAEQLASFLPTYVNFITQSAAALPSNPAPIGPLRPQDLIRATFTGTTPTGQVVPVI